MALVRFAVTTAALTLAVAGWSSVIADTFGPGSSFQPPPGELVGGGILRGDPPPNQGVTQAFEFTPVASTFLSSVELALRYVFVPGRATGPANLDVSIALDNAGMPGGALETVHLTNLFGGVALAPGVVSANSGLNPLLQAGTPYWLVVAPPDLLNTAFDWLISPRTDLLVPAAERLGMSAWTTFNTGQPLAFRVNGTAEVPEPRSAILILGILLGWHCGRFGQARRGRDGLHLKARSPARRRPLFHNFGALCWRTVPSRNGKGCRSRAGARG